MTALPTPDIAIALTHAADLRREACRHRLARAAASGRSSRGSLLTALARAGRRLTPAAAPVACCA